MGKRWKQAAALLLALTLVLALCACAVNPQELLNIFESLQTNNGESEATRPTPPEEYEEAVSDKDTATDGASLPDDSSSPNGPVNEYLPHPPSSAEGQQSLAWLRDMYSFPDNLFSVAYLGYVGGLFEEGFAAGFPQWLQETNTAMLQKHPFIAEIGGEHIIGGAGHLYCIVPQDENATLAINRIQWNGKTGTYKVTNVLYRSETGEPVLLFANLDDIPSLADTQVFVTDSSGNTCEWYPTLDEQNVIVPCVTEDGVYHATDFTEYGWQGTPSVLSDWLANGYGGPTALGLAGWEGAGSYWTTSTTVGESDRSAFFCLCVYPGDDSGGTADLYWMREDDYSYEAYWSGYWEIETVMEGPSYVTLTLFDTGSENPGTAESLCIDETYPILISPSGLELVIGAGENGVCLPFMSQSTEVCVLTLAEG